jgi:hypothetical protein
MNDFTLDESKYYQDCVTKDNTRWQSKYDITLAEIEAVKEAHKVAQMTADAWERNFHVAMDIINDLQADYAGDIQAWRNVYRTNEEINDESAGESQDRIEELETTIRVLSGMVN